MNRKVLIIIGFIVGMAMLLAITIYNLSPRAYVLFSVAPDTFKVTVDNNQSQSVKSGQTLTISPGHHDISITANGFATDKKSIDIENGKTLEILTALTPQTDDARSLLNSAVSQQILQRVGNKQLDSSVDVLNQKYPILADLPIEARYYVIRSCDSVKYPNDPTKIALCIQANQTGLEPYVKKDLETRGYNPADYEIIYQVSQ